MEERFKMALDYHLDGLFDKYSYSEEELIKATRMAMKRAGWTMTDARLDHIDGRIHYRKNIRGY